MYASASGLNAARTTLDVAAHNIANASTAGFQPLRAEHRAVAPSGGVQTTITQSDAPPLADMSGTDLATEMVNTVVASHAYDANAQMVSALMDRDRYLFDVFA
jgi:flagellar basal-body rod protein FlgC